MRSANYVAVNSPGYHQDCTNFQPFGEGGWGGGGGQLI
jgi:hypothetical protein